MGWLVVRGIQGRVDDTRIWLVFFSSCGILWERSDVLSFRKTCIAESPMAISNILTMFSSFQERSWDVNASWRHVQWHRKHAFAQPITRTLLNERIHDRSWTSSELAPRECGEWKKDWKVHFLSSSLSLVTVLFNVLVIRFVVCGVSFTTVNSLEMKNIQINHPIGRLLESRVSKKFELRVEPHSRPNRVFGFIRIDYADVLRTYKLQLATLQILREVPTFCLNGFRCVKFHTTAVAFDQVFNMNNQHTGEKSDTNSISNRGGGRYRNSRLWL